MLTSLAFSPQVNVKMSEKLLKIAKIEGKNLLNYWMNFNENFSKHITCDNIKSHKNSELYQLSRRHNFGKITGEPPQPF